MKNLKNKIFAGIFSLASLGLLENAAAQNTDSLDIKILTYNLDSPIRMMDAVIFDSIGQKNFIRCYGYEDNHYTKIKIVKKKKYRERFEIDYNTGFVNYFIDTTLSDVKIVEFKNLTKEQIYQDKEFAERTKRIINACESKEKLREMIKEIYKEGATVKIPQIKQK